MPEGVARALYVDDVALFAAERSIEKCCQTLQPCLDTVDEWLHRWKVTPSISKCCSPAFSLDPKESGGRAQSRLNMRGEALEVNLTLTFLNIRFDEHLPSMTIDHFIDLNPHPAVALGRTRPAGGGRFCPPPPAKLANGRP